MLPRLASFAPIANKGYDSFKSMISATIVIAFIFNFELKIPFFNNLELLIL